MRLVSLLMVVPLLMTSACSSEPELFEYHAIIAGGPEGWPIWAEEISLDGSFLPGGVNGRGFDKTPPVGSSRVGRDPSPAPGVVEARWFSYRHQKYYEVTI